MVRPRHGVSAFVIAKPSQPGKFMSRPATATPCRRASDSERIAIPLRQVPQRWYPAAYERPSIDFRLLLSTYWQNC
ncbi:unnamed protein product [Caenorhabditis auriculariae]|uniref:Uncharacterized protein n=1 Tax=Caenorhabditis auriculariae TaxID=2777116 RepID=A0A8S1GW93_9PELO|nr:unnamed protein product [Caenorhabditis auriculariae]